MRSFRNLPKRDVRMRFPVELFAILRERHIRELRPMNEVVAEVVALGLGRDPKEFGIGMAPAADTNTEHTRSTPRKPPVVKKRPRRPRPAAASR